ncbi:MAG: Anaerobic magnesium-protoporphyrin IX monomethyl ester cyclase, Elongator protein 3/MiaB/NifB family [Candidatus Gottesmanbacteria bacterium GW2011_GWC2_39_8]|uniref:Anaerobic magnesium-protoporphyrin IX monomethyl ester cyclase, Elongator protein 3/MiaB/NifB family n=1 Tax=Candidatus Gottesmanbacteria bacterium GW2011_GWC2_39_8 TaxID=1618450 RepID=A0A0G0Q7F7_9BACT|nr:MAG: Anaerobic magnesium-protoporphyrin IX monomethyl ester cyclase, Elongator protein 3/MiaB/NifB family [Candidatus Gottesmanbacteria bacterium GW2011_GWC2_39_8]
MGKNKIVLVRPKYNGHIITPPLGLGYLSAYLKKHSIETVIIDGLRDNLSNNHLIQRILSEKPDAVGITCLTAFYNEVIDLSNLVKKNHIRCIIGGVHPTFLPCETLVDSKADYVICGEGEIALLKLVGNNYINNDIQGVYSKGNIENMKIPIKKAEIIENLDEIPFPYWEQMDPNLYSKAPHGFFVKNFPIGVIITTRGCPYECTYCASPKFYDRKIRFRTPKNVFDEIQYLIDNFGIKEIHLKMII